MPVTSAPDLAEAYEGQVLADPDGSRLDHAAVDARPRRPAKALARAELELRHVSPPSVTRA